MREEASKTSQNAPIATFGPELWGYWKHHTQLLSSEDAADDLGNRWYEHGLMQYLLHRVANAAVFSATLLTVL
jgi:hypothetical protein